MAVTFTLPQKSDGTVTSFNVNSPEDVSVSSNNNALSTDSILRSAADNGMIDAMNQINRESSEESPPETSLQDSSSEDISPPAEQTPRKRGRRDKRITELMAEKKALQEERDRYAQALQESSLQSLSLKKQRIDSDVDTLTQLMQEAQNTQDTESYVEANKILTHLLSEKGETERAFREGYDLYQESSSSDSYEEDHLLDQKRSTLEQISHPRELNSEYYQDWLDEKPSIDPYSPDFNPSLALKFSKVKEVFNEYIHATYDPGYIGTENYYRDLDHAYSDFIQNHYGPLLSQPYNNPSFYPLNQNNNEEQEAMMKASPNLSPVVRNGNNPYVSRNDYLPELTETEKIIAINSPMYDKPSLYRNGEPPRSLENHEKIEIYRRNKAALMSRNPS